MRDLNRAYNAAASYIAELERLTALHRKILNAGLYADSVGLERYKAAYCESMRRCTALQKKYDQARNRMLALDSGR